MSDTTHSDFTRPWMRWWLLAAGLYNIVWGSVVVIAPDFPLSLANMPPLAEPGRAIWQCLGMVLAAYGLGYIAAARATSSLANCVRGTVWESHGSNWLCMDRVARNNCVEVWHQHTHQ